MRETNSQTPDYAGLRTQRMPASNTLLMPSTDCGDCLESCLYLYIPGVEGLRILDVFLCGQAPPTSESMLMITALLGAAEYAKVIGHQSAEGILSEAARNLESATQNFESAL